MAVLGIVAASCLSIVSGASQPIAPPGPPMAAGSAAYVPAVGLAANPTHAGPLNVHFEQPIYDFEPDTPTDNVWVGATNTGKEPVSLTHFSSSAYVLPQLGAPIVLKPGETAKFKVLVVTAPIRSPIRLVAVVGYEEHGHTALVPCFASGELKGVPEYSIQRLIWRVGDKPVEKSTRVTLPGGQKLTDLQLIGPSGNFSYRIDAAAGVVYVIPISTTKAVINRFNLVTTPPLHPRIQLAFSAEIENQLTLPAPGRELPSPGMPGASHP